MRGRTVTLPLDSVTVVDPALVALELDEPVKSEALTLNGLLVLYVVVAFDPAPTSATVYVPGTLVDGMEMDNVPFAGVRLLRIVVVLLPEMRSTEYDAGASGHAYS